MATWKFKGSGNWDVAGNWSLNTVPTSGDVVLDYTQLSGFSAPYTVTIPAGQHYSLSNLAIDSGFSNSITLSLSSASLSLSGTFTTTGISQVTETASSFVGNTGNFTGVSLNWSLASASTVTFTGLISGSAINFQFNDSTADRLVFGNQGNSFAGQISQFNANNSIDLTNISYGTGGFTAQQTTNGGALKILQNGVQVMTFASFNFANSTTLTAANLTFSSDGTGGTIMTVCFAAGTRIAADGGEIAVEDLRTGDHVVTLEAGIRVLREVRWVGRRRLDLRGHPNAWAVAPVRIRAGAFADGLPLRDLLVSPDHAVLVEAEGENRLLPARRLINRMSIYQEMDRRSVEYFHVELDRHSILLAEGLASESYLDTGNRGFFGNSDAPLILHPDLVGDERARNEAAPCVPFLTEEASVKPVWQRLHDRAMAAGLTSEAAATTQEAELRVVAGGCEFLPVTAKAGRYVFALPGGVEARLISRCAMATDASPWLDDRRCLGVAIERIGLRSADGLEEVAMDDPGLSQGWWDAERSGSRLHRWTDGDATIKLPGGPVLLELAVAGTTTYFLPSVDAGHLKAA